MHTGTTTTSPRSTIEVSVLLAGTAQRLYRRPFDGDLFAAGIPGKPYTLRARNLTSGRIEIISTVDGRNTLKDEPGDSSRNQGMVVPAYGEWLVTGWRINDDATREFVFGAPDRSIAAQATGSAANVGVIGFAAYRERAQPSWTATYSRDIFLGASAAAPVTFNSAAMASSGEPATRGLGTGMGEWVGDRVGHTSFTRDGEPDILVIGYDTEDALRLMGVIGPAGPNAFPGTGTGYERYAQPA